MPHYWLALACVGVIAILGRKNRPESDKSHGLEKAFLHRRSDSSRDGGSVPGRSSGKVGDGEQSLTVAEPGKPIEEKSQPKTDSGNVEDTKPQKVEVKTT